MRGPEPGSAAELDRFATLQDRLRPLFERVFPDPRAPRTVLVVPSLTFDWEVIAKIAGLPHYEERLLCMLMLLRLPRTRVVYLSSQPIAESIVDYYLQLLRGVPAGHARDRLTLIACHDPRPAALDREGARATASARSGPRGDRRSARRAPLVLHRHAPRAHAGRGARRPDLRLRSGAERPGLQERRSRDLPRSGRRLRRRGGTASGRRGRGRRARRPARSQSRAAPRGRQARRRNVGRRQCRVRLRGLPLAKCSARVDRERAPAQARLRIRRRDLGAVLGEVRRDERHRRGLDPRRGPALTVVSGSCRPARPDRVRLDARPDPRRSVRAGLQGLHVPRRRGSTAWRSKKPATGSGSSCAIGARSAATVSTSFRCARAAVGVTARSRSTCARGERRTPIARFSS